VLAAEPLLLGVRRRVVQAAGVQVVHERHRAVAGAQGAVEVEEGVAGGAWAELEGHLHDGPAGPDAV
jgi:hypothetical protein